MTPELRVDRSTLHTLIRKHKGKTPLDCLLSQISFGSDASAIDVGAGGFVGVHTTDYILKYVHGPVIAVEPVQERCDALHEKYGDRIKIRRGLFQNEVYPGSYDLIIVEPNSNMLFEAISQWLPGKIFPLLKPGGFAFFTSVASKEGARAEGSGIAPEVLNDFIDPAFDIFWNADTLDDQALDRRFSPSKLVEPIGVFPRRYDAPLVYSWAVLRRRVDAENSILAGHLF